jgi:PEGA domain
MTMRAPRIGLALTAVAAMAAGSATAFAAEPGPDTLPISVIAIQTDVADDQAEALTKALRNAVRAMPGWSLGEGDFSLEVLTLSLKCSEPPDASCQSRIADQIKSDRYVWGTIQKKNANVRGTLNFWVRGKGTSKVPVDYTANLTESTDDTLKRIAAQAIGELTGGPPKGSIHVKAGELQGQVFLDGAPLGALKSGDGTFTIPSGPHKITVKAPGYADAESQVVVKPSGAATEVTLVPIQNEAKTPVNWRKVGGFASIGVGVGLGVVGLVSSLKVSSTNKKENNEDTKTGVLYDLRAAHPGVPNVCKLDGVTYNQAQKDACGAQTAELMQIIFYPLAAVAAGLGVYLVATSAPSASKPAKTGFKFDPQIGLHSGKLDVTYTW